MNRSMKIGLGVTATLIVVIAGASIFLLSNLDGLIKEAVERVGSEATQAKVSLNEVSISIKSGSGSLRGLKVANPKGFKTPSAFELGGISITLDIASIGQDPIVIKEITITKPQVTYELEESARASPWRVQSRLLWQQACRRKALPTRWRASGRGG